MLRRMEELCDAVLARLDLSGGGRRLVALSGAPGSGKSTLSEPLAAMLTERGVRSEVVPMDGFHLDNRLLKARGLMPRKGAPETFDLGGFKRLCHALRADDEVIYPLFDRSRDLAIAGAAHVGQDCSVAVIEGNYLLFDEPGWRDLADLWDVSIRLDVPLADLEARLVQRWLTHGLDQAAAEARARGNDLANAQRIASAKLPADLTWR
ncbi:nucleoside triphosphate hydrolase [Tritonibacter scottomollicae]|uniref:nucleoside triphosphate hydrolase n=1 Tax=Tritonibacter scottomollicae TaxID=483013 RepID=UPI003AA8B3A1